MYNENATDLKNKLLERKESCRRKKHDRTESNMNAKVEGRKERKRNPAFSKKYKNKGTKKTTT